MSHQHIESRRWLRLCLAGALTLSFWPMTAGRGLATETDPPKPAPALQLFSEEAEAHAHCPTDKVIRIDLPDGFYLHGDRGFGGTSLGRVFVCRDEALRLFARPSP